MSAVYRLDQAIPRAHIEAVKQGRYQLKGHGRITRVVNAETHFAFEWNFVQAFVLVRYTGVGMVAIHDGCLAVEYHKGHELYLELHVNLDGEPPLTGNPALFYHKRFQDGSTQPTPNGDLAATGELPENWMAPHRPGECTTGAWRFTIKPGQVINQRVDFPKPFSTAPGVTASILSRNLPSTRIDEISLRTADTDTHGFTLTVSTPKNEVWLRCVVGWQAVEFRSALDKKEEASAPTPPK